MSGPISISPNQSLPACHPGDDPFADAHDAGSNQYASSPSSSGGGDSFWQLLQAPDHPAASPTRTSVTAQPPLPADEKAVLDGAGSQALANYQEGKAAVSEPKRELAEAHRAYKETGRIPQTKTAFAWIEIKEGRRMSRAERYDAMIAKPGYENPTAADVGEGHIDLEYLTQEEFRDEFYSRAGATASDTASATNSRSAPEGCELPGSPDAGICVPVPARTASDRTAVWVTQAQINQGKRNGAELLAQASMLIPGYGQFLAVYELVGTAMEAFTGKRAHHLADVIVSNPQGGPGTPLTDDERAAAAIESIIVTAAAVVGGAGLLRGIGGEANAAIRVANAEANAAAKAAKQEAKIARAEAREAARAAAARAGEVIQGPYGQVTRGELEALANSNGPMLTVRTNLTGPPRAGIALSTAFGEGAEALTNAARASGGTYVAQIPRALVERLKDIGLAVESTTSMQGVAAKELRFTQAASEFVVGRFQRQ